MVIINNCTLIGRLTADPQLRYLPNGGQCVANFTLAVDKGLSKEKKQELEAQGKPVADFPKIIAWGKTAELIANYTKKGSLIAIQGSLQTGSYNKDDGTKVYTTDVNAFKVEFLGGRNDNQRQGDNNNNNSNSGFNGDGFEPVSDDEIPF